MIVKVKTSLESRVLKCPDEATEGSWLHATCAWTEGGTEVVNLSELFHKQQQFNFCFQVQII